MDVNLKAVWLATKAAAPHLRASDRGPSIVNSASVAGVHGTVSAIAYGASKAGVIQLTKSCAVALGPHDPRQRLPARQHRHSDGAGPPRLGQPIARRRSCG